MSFTRLSGTVVLAGALLTSTACGGVIERIDPCGELFDQLDAVTQKMTTPTDRTSDYVPLSAADAAFFRDAAAKIRRVGERLDKDGPAEAREVAAEIDAVADSLSRLPAGTRSTQYSEVIDGSAIYINNETLKAACGRPPGAG
ncbi:hypothetical protein E1281_24875 [Actinomadura sp. KC345]|uniref:hypothetical protein n=1 Tax=Actinomadura sp. KC345 TaxID=2530371 RepID=UPI00104AB036|nr:hypothetical protein [Actinomadura sp. KC345]TDC48388.1 hypothetical protein E1281_24875 [Actinomadura sp. KC345]